MKRINVEGSATLKDLYDVVYKTLSLIDYGFSLFTDRGLSKEIRSTRSETVKSNKIGHGDIVYYKQNAGSTVSSLIILNFTSISFIKFYLFFSHYLQHRVVHQQAVYHKHQFH
jgi:hypothetical protein